MINCKFSHEAVPEARMDTYPQKASAKILSVTIYCSGGALFLHSRETSKNSYTKKKKRSVGAYRDK